MSDKDIVEFNIPMGVPIVYELDGRLRAQRHYYLGDAEKIRQTIDAVAGQLGKPARGG
jgi:2,3-bisphosphoglycerate-dependent phosphoglycerate mutase